MTSSSKIKFAVIGQGHIGKRHAEMIRKNEHAELVAVCDIDEKSFPADVKGYTTISQLLEENKDVDVINICSPNGLHAEHSLLALKAGKHVVCEKPMALKKSDCEKVIHTALQNNLIYFVVMQNRYSPPSVWLKKIIEEKILGKIYFVQLNCFWNRDNRYYSASNWKGTHELDGGTLFTQFSHFIDILYWVFGDIENIHAKFFNFNHSKMIDFEDTGIVNFDLLNGGSGIMNYSTSVYNKNMESSMTIIAENGSIKIGGQYMEKVEYCHIKDYEMPNLEPTNAANDYGNYKGSANNHHYVIQNVIDTLQKKSSIKTNALEGMKVVEMIENIYKQNPFITK